ncbi:calcium ion binding [Desmophyllum pertusum]|uniref:Calcium ion binding n=1 Tax=Desmophyllum pertusum TaxID=174260 RepID=A0A9X0DCW5_9CNID|nr:calcium ion binding [Desmophyllum pertusum]
MSFYLSILQLWIVSVMRISAEEGTPLLVTMIPQTEVTETGSNVKFTCKVTGQYNPVVTWSKFQGSLPDSRSIEKEDTLTLLNVTTDDSGSYVCTGTSIMGTNSSSVQLRVYTALKFITRPPSSVLVYAGQTLNLSCSASSDLQTNVSWMFDGTTTLPQGAAIDASDNLIVCLLTSLMAVTTLALL